MKWQEIELKELITRLVDYRGKTPRKTDSGIKLITARVIKDGCILENVEHEYIAEEAYDETMRRGVPRVNDIIITTEAPLGEIAMIANDEKIALAQRVILFTPDVEKVVPRFLYYSFFTTLIQERLQAKATGTTVPGISNPNLQSIRIPIPPLPIQRRIADVLGRYDALIENYQRQIRLLETMAQTLYREWFVRGRCPGAEAADFEAKSLSEIAQVNLQSISEKDENAVINYVDISSVGTGRINEITAYTLREAPGRARRLVQHGDIVFSTVRPENRCYALILSPTSNLVFSTGFAVITPKQLFYSSFIYCSISTDSFITEIANKAKGAAYPQVGFDDLMETKLTVPSDESLMRFHQMAEPLFQKAENLQLQITHLRQMRDKLLPRLMSGQFGTDSH